MVCYRVMVHERVLANALVNSVTRENCAVNAWTSSLPRIKMKHIPFVNVSHFVSYKENPVKQDLCLLCRYLL